MYNIYCIKDPVSHEVMYVGCTSKDIEKRLYSHVTEGRRLKWSPTDKDLWINSLLKLNLKPYVELLGVTDECSWELMEIFWIKYFRCLNPGLLNKSIGGKARGRKYESSLAKQPAPNN